MCVDVSPGNRSTLAKWSITFDSLLETMVICHWMLLWRTKLAERDIHCFPTSSHRYLFSPVAPNHQLDMKPIVLKLFGLREEQAGLWGWTLACSVIALAKRQLQLRITLRTVSTAIMQDCLVSSNLVPQGMSVPSSLWSGTERGSVLGNTAMYSVPSAS